MKKNRVWRAALQVGSALTLVLTLGLTGCDTGGDDNPSLSNNDYTGSGETVNVDTLANLTASLSGLPPRNSSSNPHTVILSSSFTINNNDSSDTGVWATVNNAVKESGKYVVLDLSACSASNNTVTGTNGVLLANSMNIIKYNQYITGIILPNTITSIGADAFYGCAGLLGVTIPAGVTSIGGNIFEGCTGLVSISVDVSNSVYSSAEGVLFNKAKTTLIICPAAKSGRSYSIPAGVNSIERLAFSGSRLGSVSIPAGVTSIGAGAFSSCTYLEDITVDASNNAYSSAEGVLFNKAKTSLIKYPAWNERRNYTIPSDVESIENSAFSGCYKLTSLTIPAGVTSIEAGAFYSCWGLTGITIPVGVVSIEDSAFFECFGLTSITIPAGVTSIAANAFSYCEKLTSLTISGTGAITQNLFQNFSTLTSLTISGSITSIGDGAFGSCDNLTRVTFEENSNIDTGSFGSGAFPGNSDSLKNVYLTAPQKAGTYTRAANGTWTK